MTGAAESSLRAAVPGTVYWVTGLSGAGKTTFAERLLLRLREAGRCAVLLDGDRLRATFPPQAESTGAAARREYALSYGRLCRELSIQGVDVVCATISMFHEVRRWNREQIPRYVEIYLKVPIEELRRRDPKGIYAGADAGNGTNVVGLDLGFEAPDRPDLVLEGLSLAELDAAVRSALRVEVSGHG